MIKRITIVFAVFCCFCTVLKSQDSLDITKKSATNASFLLKFGLNSASGENIRQVYGIGYSLGMGVAIKLLHNHLWVSPELGVTYFGNNYNKGLRDDLLFSNKGASIAWLFPLDKQSDIYFSPEFGVYHVKGNNKFRPRKDYTGDDILIYSFESYELRPGISLQLKRFKLTATYSLLEITGKLDDYIKEEIVSSAWGDLAPPIYDMFLFPERKFDMSYLHLGMTFIF
jgi:hypothetical protein